MRPPQSGRHGSAATVQLLAQSQQQQQRQKVRQIDPLSLQLLDLTLSCDRQSCAMLPVCSFSRTPSSDRSLVSKLSQISTMGL